MVSIRVKPASRSPAQQRLALLHHAHIAGQPIDAHGCPPGPIAQYELAAAGAAVGEKAYAHHVGGELLGNRDLHVDGQARRQRASHLRAIEPHAPVADIEDKGLIDVASLRGGARVAQLASNVVCRCAQLVAGARAFEVGEGHGHAERHDAERYDQFDQGEPLLMPGLTAALRPHHCSANSLTLTMAPITDRMRPPTTTPMTTVRIGVSKLVTRSSWRCRAAS